MAAFELHISGLAGPLCVVCASEDWHLLDLHKAVAENTSIPTDQQRLICGATVLRGTEQLLTKLLPTGFNEILCVRSKQWVEIPYYSGDNGLAVKSWEDRAQARKCKTLDEARATCHENEDLWGFTMRSVKDNADSPTDLDFKGTGSKLGHNNRTGSTFVKLTPAGREVLLDALRVTRGTKKEIIRAITDLDTIIAAVQENASVFRSVCDDLRCNVQVAEVAVLANPFALQFAPEAVKDDAEIVRKAIETNAFALNHASERLKSDRDLVLLATDRDPGAIRYASEGLRGDPDFCMSAIQRDGNILRLLHDNLRDNHCIVMAAVQQKGQALCFASSRLRADANIIAAAVQCDPEAAQFAFSHLSSL